MINDKTIDMIDNLQKKTRTVREVCTAYICTQCDTDFGINEMGINVDVGITAVRCPLCDSVEFHVYYVVVEKEREPAHQKYNAKEEEEKWRKWRKDHPLGWLS